MSSIDNKEEIIDNGEAQNKPKPLKKLKRVQPSRAAAPENNNGYVPKHEASSGRYVGKHEAPPKENSSYRGLHEAPVETSQYYDDDDEEYDDRPVKR